MSTKIEHVTLDISPVHVSFTRQHRHFYIGAPLPLDHQNYDEIGALFGFEPNAFRKFLVQCLVNLTHTLKIPGKSDYQCSFDRAASFYYSTLEMMEKSRGDTSFGWADFYERFSKLDDQSKNWVWRYMKDNEQNIPGRVWYTKGPEQKSASEWNQFHHIPGMENLGKTPLLPSKEESMSPWYKVYQEWNKLESASKKAMAEYIRWFHGLKPDWSNKPEIPHIPGYEYENNMAEAKEYFHSRGIPLPEDISAEKFCETFRDASFCNQMGFLKRIYADSAPLPSALLLSASNAFLYSYFNLLTPRGKMKFFDLVIED
jgi:hypothetical protein